MARRGLGPPRSACGIPLVLAREDGRLVGFAYGTPVSEGSGGPTEQLEGAPARDDAATAVPEASREVAEVIMGQGTPRTPGPVHW